MNHNRWLRCTALLTALIYVPVNHFGFAAAITPQPVSTESAGLQPLKLSTLKIPTHFGEVVSFEKGTTGQTVIVIQDAHAIPDAQKNIANVIKFMQKEYGVGTVALEGASGDLDTQIFKSFPDQKLMREVIKGYLDAGEIAGGTAAAIFDKAPSVYKGVEDWDLYEEALGFYLKAMEESPALLEKLNTELLTLDAEKQKIYSHELLKADAAVEKFYSNLSEVTELFKVLGAVQAPQAGSDLEAVWKEVQKTNDQRLKTDDKDVEVREIAKRVEKFLKAHSTDLKNSKLPAISYRLDALKTFNARKQEWMTGAVSPEAFAMYLKETASKFKIQIEMSTELLGMVREQRKLKELEGTKFFKELEAYIRDVKVKLIQSPDSTYAVKGIQPRRLEDLDKQTSDLRTLKKLLNLELTREEWNALKLQMQFQQTTDHRLSTTDKKQSVSGSESLWSSVVSRQSLVYHLAFYASAEERDEVFFKNIAKQIPDLTARDPGSSLGGVTIMVAGGFHAEGLTSRLKAAGIGYAIVMPKINHIPENMTYRAQMRGEVSWKDYFEVENGRIHLYKAFVRAVRDRLLQTTDNRLSTIDSNGKRSMVYSPSSMVTLKAWRDQIIRDLSDQGKVERAAWYTRYMDEVLDPTIDQRLKTNDKLMSKVDNFIRGLRGLEKNNQIDQAHIAQLLKANMLGQVTAVAPMAPSDSVSSNLLRGSLGNRFFAAALALVSALSFWVAPAKANPNIVPPLATNPVKATIVAAEEFELARQQPQFDLLLKYLDNMRTGNNLDRDSINGPTNTTLSLIFDAKDGTVLKPLIKFLKNKLTNMNADDPERVSLKLLSNVLQMPNFTAGNLLESEKGVISLKEAFIFGSAGNRIDAGTVDGETTWLTPRKVAHLVTRWVRFESPAGSIDESKTPTGTGRSEAREFSDLAVELVRKLGLENETMGFRTIDGLLNNNDVTPTFSLSWLSADINARMLRLKMQLINLKGIEQLFKAKGLLLADVDAVLSKTLNVDLLQFIAEDGWLVKIGQENFLRFTVNQAERLTLGAQVVEVNDLNSNNPIVGKVEVPVGGLKSKNTMNIQRGSYSVALSEFGLHTDLITRSEFRFNGVLKVGDLNNQVGVDADQLAIVRATAQSATVRISYTQDGRDRDTDIEVPLNEWFPIQITEIENRGLKGVVIRLEEVAGSQRLRLIVETNFLRDIPRSASTQRLLALEGKILDDELRKKPNDFISKYALFRTLISRVKDTDRKRSFRELAQLLADLDFVYPSLIGEFKDKIGSEYSAQLLEVDKKNLARDLFLNSEAIGDKIRKQADQFADELLAEVAKVQAQRARSVEQLEKLGAVLETLGWNKVDPGRLEPLTNYVSPVRADGFEIEVSLKQGPDQSGSVWQFVLSKPGRTFQIKKENGIVMTAGLMPFEDANAEIGMDESRKIIITLVDAAKAEELNEKIRFNNLSEVIEARTRSESRNEDTAKKIAVSAAAVGSIAAVVWVIPVVQTIPWLLAAVGITFAVSLVFGLVSIVVMLLNKPLPGTAPNSVTMIQLFKLLFTSGSELRNITNKQAGTMSTLGTAVTRSELRKSWLVATGLGIAVGLGVAFLTGNYWINEKSQLPVLGEMDPTTRMFVISAAWGVFSTFLFTILIGVYLSTKSTKESENKLGLVTKIYRVLPWLDLFFIPKSGSARAAVNKIMGLGEVSAESKLDAAAINTWIAKAQQDMARVGRYQRTVEKETLAEKIVEEEKAAAELLTALANSTSEELGFALQAAKNLGAKAEGIENLMRQIQKRKWQAVTRSESRSWKKEPLFDFAKKALRFFSRPIALVGLVGVAALLKIVVTTDFHSLVNVFIKIVLSSFLSLIALFVVVPLIGLVLLLLSNIHFDPLDWLGKVLFQTRFAAWMNRPLLSAQDKKNRSESRWPSEYESKYPDGWAVFSGLAWFDDYFDAQRVKRNGNSMKGSAWELTNLIPAANDMVTQLTAAGMIKETAIATLAGEIAANRQQLLEPANPVTAVAIITDFGMKAKDKLLSPEVKNIVRAIEDAIAQKFSGGSHDVRLLGKLLPEDRMADIYAAISASRQAMLLAGVESEKIPEAIAEGATKIRNFSVDELIGGIKQAGFNSAVSAGVAAEIEARYEKSKALEFLATIPPKSVSINIYDFQGKMTHSGVFLGLEPRAEQFTTFLVIQESPSSKPIRVDTLLSVTSVGIKSIGRSEARKDVKEPDAKEGGSPGIMDVSLTLAAPGRAALNEAFDGLRNEQEREPRFILLPVVFGVLVTAVLSLGVFFFGWISLWFSTPLISAVIIGFLRWMYQAGLPPNALLKRLQASGKVVTAARLQRILSSSSQISIEMTGVLRMMRDRRNQAVRDLAQFAGGQGVQIRTDSKTGLLYLTIGGRQDTLETSAQDLIPWLREIETIKLPAAAKKQIKEIKRLDALMRRQENENKKVGGTDKVWADHASDLERIHALDLLAAAREKELGELVAARDFHEVRRNALILSMTRNEFIQIKDELVTEMMVVDGKLVERVKTSDQAFNDALQKIVLKIPAVKDYFDSISAASDTESREKRIYFSALLKDIADQLADEKLIQLLQPVSEGETYASYLTTQFNRSEARLIGEKGLLGRVVGFDEFIENTSMRESFTPWVYDGKNVSYPRSDDSIGGDAWLQVLMDQGLVWAEFWDRGENSTYAILFEEKDRDQIKAAQAKLYFEKIPSNLPVRNPLVLNAQIPLDIGNGRTLYTTEGMSLDEKKAAFEELKRVYETEIGGYGVGYLNLDSDNHRNANALFIKIKGEIAGFIIFEPDRRDCQLTLQFTASRYAHGGELHDSSREGIGTALALYLLKMLSDKGLYNNLTSTVLTGSNRNARTGAGLDVKGTGYGLWKSLGIKTGRSFIEESDVGRLGIERLDIEDAKALNEEALKQSHLKINLRYLPVDLWIKKIIGQPPVRSESRDFSREIQKIVDTLDQNRADQKLPALSDVVKERIRNVALKVQEMHNDQTRKDGRPYFVHQLDQTLRALQNYNVASPVSVMINLLHDTREDQEEGYEDFKANQQKLINEFAKANPDLSDELKKELQVEFNLIRLGVRLLTKIESKPGEEYRVDAAEAKALNINEGDTINEQQAHQLYLMKLVNPRAFFNKELSGDPRYSAYTDEFIRDVQIGKLSDRAANLNDLLMMFQPSVYESFSDEAKEKANKFPAKTFDKTLNEFLPFFVNDLSAPNQLKEQDRAQFLRDMVDALQKYAQIDINEPENRYMGPLVESAKAALANPLLSSFRSEVRVQKDSFKIDSKTGVATLNLTSAQSDLMARVKGVIPGRNANLKSAAELTLTLMKEGENWSVMAASQKGETGTSGQGIARGKLSLSIELQPDGTYEVKIVARSEARPVAATADIYSPDERKVFDVIKGIVPENSVDGKQSIRGVRDMSGRVSLQSTSIGQGNLMGTEDLVVKFQLNAEESIEAKIRFGFSADSTLPYAVAIKLFTRIARLIEQEENAHLAKVLIQQVNQIIEQASSAANPNFGSDEAFKQIVDMIDIANTDVASNPKFHLHRMGAVPTKPMSFAEVRDHFTGLKGLGIPNLNIVLVVQLKGQSFGEKDRLIEITGVTDVAVSEDNEKLTIFRSSGQSDFFKNRPNLGEILAVETAPPRSESRLPAQVAGKVAKLFEDAQAADANQQALDKRADALAAQIAAMSETDLDVFVSALLSVLRTSLPLNGRYVDAESAEIFSREQTKNFAAVFTSKEPWVQPIFLTGEESELEIQDLVAALIANSQGLEGVFVQVPNHKAVQKYEPLFRLLKGNNERVVQVKVQVEAIGNMTASWLRDNKGKMATVISLRGIDFQLGDNLRGLGIEGSMDPVARPKSIGTMIHAGRILSSKSGAVTDAIAAEIGFALQIPGAFKRNSNGTISMLPKLIEAVMNAIRSKQAAAVAA